MPIGVVVPIPMFPVLIASELRLPTESVIYLAVADNGPTPSSCRLSAATYVLR